MKIAPGVRLGVFEILGLLGLGGMGEVYRAHDTRLGRDVALKRDSQGVPVLVLELVEGPTLADRLAAASIALEDVLSIALQITEALEAAHARGVIHRDLKPANIKVTPEGTVKLLDFGLAKALDDGSPGSDRQAEALEQLAPLERIRLDAHLSLHVAESHAVAGDNPRALVLLRQAVEQGFHPHAFIARHGPFFEALRRDVTFEQIVAEAHTRCEGFRV